MQITHFMGATWSQFFPPHPTLTETNLPSQKGKVFIVTGGYSGVGYELVAILYQAGAKVYLAGRSEEKANAAIAEIKAQPTKKDLSETGEIVFLHLSLDDLTTIKPAVEKFTSAESRLDVLFNNAGVSNPPTGSVSAQGHELQLATNVLGPHLLTQLLLPTLRNTAKSLPPGSVRVIWTSSIADQLQAPKNGIELSELERPHSDPQHNYTLSKLGNWYLAHGLAKQAGSDGILTVTQNPGNLKSNLTRHLPSYVAILAGPLLHHARKGAYTELWAGLSPDLKIEDNGKYVVPWGRLHPNPRQDLLATMKSKDEGGNGVAAIFLEFADKQIADFK
ncbi:steroid dehydrogenase, putative [Talaromyces stipitatus ATCC 10500]|uniref:Steroid dehydrogenase, putative n=1 Tax=Talaromyces stipitatus (strain ATCC 10500 / CBS 375.48 / QM 6759 / NRRL 1006) TaxID=441959 RepID=B8LXY4_TALSN|nr:steroid dehydrogenase, putative [Talaromyces stipitatus ATCC 10500]EED22799.1 steroid dehydrogenase, putative [Talaromyces stipitatus ATCC 10500]